MPVQSTMVPYGVEGDMSGIAMSGVGKFPNPFFDIASEYMPRDLNQILEFAEYIYMNNGTYRAAARRVARYFLTEITLDGESETEREDYEDFIKNKLHMVTQLAEIGDEFLIYGNCLQGDTPVITRDGVFPIRQLAGKEVDVLSKDGVYRSAKFACYGEQPLLAVDFSDGRTILATPEHQWLARNCSDKEVRVPTTTLRNGYSIERTVAPRPEKNDEFYEGVRHGFVFGDGSTYNKSRKRPICVANFYGDKDKAMLPYFDGHGNAPLSYMDNQLIKIQGLPNWYKTLPAPDATASYWYGFVCGFLAADGSVDKCGCPLLTQVKKADLEAIIEQLPRIGMVAGELREYENHSTFKRQDGTEYYFDGKYCVVALLKRFMREDDLLIPAHRLKFIDRPGSAAYGKYIGVVGVRDTGLTEPVYCCVEPETHTFVIGNGVLTGNCFVSVYFPFDRYLICPSCSTNYHIDTVGYRWSFKDLEFSAKCQKCGHDGVFDRRDVRSLDKDRVKLIRWNPKRIRMRVHDISGRVEHYYEPESTFVQKLEEGNRFFLNDTPWSLIECCSKSDKSGTPLYKFDVGQLYHLRESTLSGLPIKGWGIPPALANFKLSYYIQLLRRYDEAVALDYIIPFRILHPTAQTPGGMNTDPLMSLSMDTFMSHMKNMVKAKRQNITDIQIAPFPIGYQTLGGEVRALTPKDLIQNAVDELLNAVGFPAELYRGSISIQAAPTALRLFEKTWSSLVDGYNDLIAWILTKVSRYYGWGEMTGELRSVTLADDIERKALNFQAAAGMDISKDTAFRPLGVDYMEEQRKVVEEQREIQKLQQEAMEEQEAAQLQQQGGGGSGGGAGGQAGATPGDVHEQAKELAYQLVVQTPETARRGEIIKIKHSNPTLHALVIQEMETLRQDMARQGQGIVLQQEQQKQGSADGFGAAALPSPLALGLLLSSQVMDIDRRYMRKVAQDIDIPGVRGAFRFIRDRQLGLA
jgi:hypothetical protein